MEQTGAITLKEFNRLVGAVLANAALKNRWIIADLSDVAVRGGHCYMELVDKNPQTGKTEAKTRGIIWANTYPDLKYKFESETGQQFGSNIKVMLKASVNFHEQFGYSVVITDINPSYTLGDMERKRREIIERLTREGIIDDNKQLEMPLVPQRIAVISAAGAAGYGDFMNQLHNNKENFIFYTALFEARMQGAETAPTVIAALDRIAQHTDLFDCVVIIRGGGATSDLNSFDDYDLAANVAQFPLPVITGIGHERDNTVIDYVSNLRVKTPTAAAEWLIDCAHKTMTAVNNLSQTVVSAAKEYILGAREQLAYIDSSIPHIAKSKITDSKSSLEKYALQIPAFAKSRTENAATLLNTILGQIRDANKNRISMAKMKLEHIAETVNVLSPINTLKRGYSITRINGKAVTSANNIPENAEMTTITANGEIISIVKSKNI